MLENEYAYFKANKESIIDSHLNKFVVIVDEQIIAEYDTIEEAIRESLKRYKMGDFLVEFCTTDEEFYHVTLYNWSVA